MMLFPELAMAAGKGDLMVKVTIRLRRPSVRTPVSLNGVVLAEVLVGAVMYMMTKNVKFPGSALPSSLYLLLWV